MDAQRDALILAWAKNVLGPNSEGVLKLLDIYELYREYFKPHRDTYPPRDAGALGALIVESYTGTELRVNGNHPLIKGLMWLRPEDHHREQYICEFS